ncbi:MAG TPA: AAA family ATPase [Thermoanaerobaculia bacterium]|nr:AAA family ATPase [Thermoanaerobaculia bacterium]
MTSAAKTSSDAPGTTSFAFPQLLNVQMHAFSLYRRVPDASVAIADGVSCLVGANGLGKSTFIAVVNFGLTGRVAQPDRTFKSPEEYYRETQSFTREYFGGRIDEEDRPSAEVTIDFRVGTTTFSVTRGFFDLSELRALRVMDDQRVVYEGTSDNTAGAELHRHYETELCDRAGFENFSQFVFLQLFVLTFDERRHLAFWDARTLQHMLFLAFRVGTDTASRAETLARTFDRQDSLTRNYQWQATETRKKLRDLDRATSDAEAAEDEIGQQHRALLEQQQEILRALDTKRAELADHRVQVAEATTRYITLQDEYDRLFHARSKQVEPLRHHPIVVTTINEHRCAVCGTADASKLAAIEKAVSDRQCPLCKTQLPTAGKRDPKTVEALQRVDRELAATRSRMTNTTLAVRRVEDEVREAESRYAAMTDQLTAFERDNEIASRPTGSDVGSIRAMYTNQIDRLLEQKQAARDKRDRAKEELSKLQHAVRKKYEQVEEEFVPLFRDLAFSFLGLNLDIKFSVRSAEISLALVVERKHRVEPHQLSESQRFFVDIALRMALARFMVGGETGALMMIDTPEGSLDAAYESRAGDMFAKFARAGNHVLMTANVNTSRLLLRLAERCGHRFMTLIRMTEWAYLSEVQEAEEDQFEAAYAAIEACLLKGDAQNESGRHV